MTYTAKDIEVFFFAHDRAEMLRQAIDCYVNQTVQGARLVLLANAPTPDVLDVAREYAAKGVELVYEPKSLNVFGCVQRCRELASRAITVMAHDDDLIHPAYLETLLKAYNQIPKLNVAISAMGDWNDNPFGEEYHTKCAILKNVSEFSAYIFLGHSFTFSSASYLTKTLKLAPAPDFSTYGKVQDVPFMLGACMDGAAAVLQYPFIKYRIHTAQDCQTFSTGPTAKQWLALDLLHKKLMSSGGNHLCWAYALNSYHRLRIGWRDWCRCEHGKMTFKQYMDLALVKQVITTGQRLIGYFLRGNVRKKILDQLFHYNTIDLQ